MRVESGMRLTLSTAIIVCAFHFMGMAFGQVPSLVDDAVLDMLRVVEDPDGHTNLRSGPSLKDKVIGQVPSGSVVAIQPGPRGEWMKLASDDLGDRPRYIHSSRLKEVKHWKQTAVTHAKGSDGVVLKLAGIEVRVVAVPFVASEHRMALGAQGMQLVDGKSPWGTDGGLPREALSIAGIQNGKGVEVPGAAVQNLFQPNMDSLVLLTPSHPAERAVVMMTNSDGAGAYCVAWAFERGSYRGRAVFSPY